MKAPIGKTVGAFSFMEKSLDGHPRQQIIISMKLLAVMTLHQITELNILFRLTLFNTDFFAIPIIIRNFTSENKKYIINIKNKKNYEGICDYKG